MGNQFARCVLPREWKGAVHIHYRHLDFRLISSYFDNGRPGHNQALLKTQHLSYLNCFPTQTN